MSLVKRSLTIEQILELNEQTSSYNKYSPIKIVLNDASRKAWKCVIVKTGELVYIPKSQSILPKEPHKPGVKERTLFVKNWLIARERWDVDPDIQPPVSPDIATGTYVELADFAKEIQELTQP